MQIPKQVMHPSRVAPDSTLVGISSAVGAIGERGFKITRQKEFGIFECWIRHQLRYKCRFFMDDDTSFINRDLFIDSRCEEESLTPWVLSEIEPY